MEDRPTQARTPAEIQPPSAAAEPMRHVGTDIFDALGNSWLVLVDRFSGYAWVKKLKSTDSAAIKSQLSKWFTEYGWPKYIRSDGGPQFRKEFADFCKLNGITHELSSPYNPESNGLAEAAVKNMKAIVTRCSKMEEDIETAIAAWRNMLRTDGNSPSQLFFGRRQRQRLPVTHEHTQIRSYDISSKDKIARESEKRRNAHTRQLDELHPGERVRMQNHIDNRWDRQVTIINKREDGNSYNVRGDNGKTYIRGRRLLRKSLDCEQSNVKDTHPQVTSEAEKKPEEKRRPGRPKKGEGKAKETTPEVMPRCSTRLNQIHRVLVSRVVIEYGGPQE